MSRISETKSYLFRRFVTNIFKYKSILAKYENDFRQKLRSEWANNPEIVNTPENYKKFFSDEFEKYHKSLKEETTCNINVEEEVEKRFFEFERHLESNLSKRKELQVDEDTFLMITGEKERTGQFGSIWLRPSKEKTTIVRKSKTDSDGNITWSNHNVRGDDERSTLAYFGNKIKASIDDLLSSCEKYSDNTLDRVLYKVHKDVNKVTKKHREALRLFSFAKLYLKKELKNIHSKWEKENNVADRFGAKENREKMWQNFAASCQDLTDFQMIQEMI